MTKTILAEQTNLNNIYEPQSYGAPEDFDLSELSEIKMEDIIKKYQENSDNIEEVQKLITNDNSDEQPEPPTDSTLSIIEEENIEASNPSTGIAIVEEKNRFLTIPEAPKELGNFITWGTKTMEAAQGIMKKSNISGEEFKYLHQKNKELGLIVLDAGLRFACDINNIPTLQGKHPNKQLISFGETSETEIIRTKKDILEKDYGLTEKQAWKISRLTNYAVDKEKKYANDNNEAPSLTHAYSFVTAQKKQLNKAQQKTVIFENRNRTEPVVLPSGKFNVICGNYDVLSNNSNIENSIDDSAIIFISAETNQITVSINLIKSLGFNYADCAIVVKDKIKPKNHCFQSKHSQVLVGVKGEYSKPDIFTTPSVFYENEFDEGGEVEYLNKLVERMYPNGTYLDLVSEKEMNNKWSICKVEGEA